METTLTLIARPGALKDAATAAARNLAASCGVAIVEERVLSPGEAWDARLARPLAAAAVAAFEEGLAGQVDVIHQTTEHRRKRLLVADMDSTIITAECIDEIAACLGLKERIAAITERAMRGEIAFEPALEERVRLLAGLPETELAAVHAERVRLTAGAATLTATMRANGAVTALVSGGFTFFTSRVAAEAGFDRHQGNTLGIADGRLTGAVVPPILGQDAKRDALERLCAEHGIPLSASLAVGDGANDLMMIAHAGLGVAFHAKPKVAAAASARIQVGDLTALLFLQGYAREDFVAPKQA